MIILLVFILLIKMFHKVNNYLTNCTYDKKSNKIMLYYIKKNRNGSAYLSHSQC